MGRRGRLLREAVAAGRVLPVKELKRSLYREVLRLAIPRLFADASWDDKPVKGLAEYASAVAVKVLPEALENTGIRLFTVEEVIGGAAGWNEFIERFVQGVASRHKSFRRMDARGDLWRIRKGSQGRKATGSWGFCLDCGAPRWQTPSRQTKRCRDCWRAARKKP